jgi:hypothetical protein
MRLLPAAAFLLLLVEARRMLSYEAVHTAAEGAGLLFLVVVGALALTLLATVVLAIWRS